jgi:hypothetical protein
MSTVTLIELKTQKEIKMKHRSVVLTLPCLVFVCVALAVIPASACPLYTCGWVNGYCIPCSYGNGFLNGGVTGWNFTNDSVSNTFHPSGGTVVSGFGIGAWETPGDTLSSLDWSVADSNGNVLAAGTASRANLVDLHLFTNQYGYNIDSITVSGLAVALFGGSYWLNLTNAITLNGDPVWDQNSGVGCPGNNGLGGGCPSSALDSAVGSIPSEAFYIAAPTPEPSSILLVGWGILGLVGVVRRRLL